MSELFDHLDKLKNTEPRVAVATLVNTRGTTPRKEGAKMVVGEGGRVLGSVTIGGCVDAQVIEQSADVLDQNRPAAARARPGRRGSLGDRAHLRRHHRGLPRAGVAGQARGRDARLLREGAGPRRGRRARRGHDPPRRRHARGQAPAHGRRHRRKAPWAIRSSTPLRRRGAGGHARGQVADALPRGRARLRRGRSRLRPSWPWSARATSPCRS